MAYTLRFNPTLRIVELVFTGRYTAQVSRESTSKAIALGKEHGDVDALVDASKAELAVSLFDLLDLPARQYDRESMNRRIRVAVVPPSLPNDLELAQFYETACLNRGWQVQLFPNRKDAIEWLTGTDSSKKQDGGDDQ
jgi:hypothetical protein